MELDVTVKLQCNGLTSHLKKKSLQLTESKHTEKINKQWGWTFSDHIYVFMYTKCTCRVNHTLTMLHRECTELFVDVKLRKESRRVGRMRRTR